MVPPVAIPRDALPPAVGSTVRGSATAGRRDAPVRATSPGHIAALVRAAVPPMHPGGRPIVAGVAAAAGLARLVTGRGTVVGALVTTAVAAFFRNPRRVPPSRTGVVLSAADGTVALVSEVVPPPELDLPRVPAPRVSVFLSVLDVHVQRVPADGRVLDVQYRPGRFLSADLDKASEDNERNALLLETVDGARIGVVQIAGLLARRIRCDVRPGDEVAAGETYGLIRFGSRVDTYLPAGSTVTVEVGQRTIGGETVLAELPARTEPPGTERSGAPGPA
ncbi:MAG: phosphatidylserine decarboxylase [Pseudonocardiales bacterium]|jgi:phosphatidylserine decarboxylase|nr:phosphatidylserine decarboxylase [Pseudonocardiales bacterium]